MKSEYTFSSGRKLNTTEFFPDREGKVAILFTGGIESYILALMCKEKYGIDNIVFLLNVSPSASNFRARPDKQRAVIDTFNSSVKRIGGVHTMIIDYDIDEMMLREHYVQLLINIVCEQYPGTEALYGGYSYVHNEMIQLLIDSGWWNGTVTTDGTMKYYEENKSKYPATAHILEVCGHTGGLYWASPPQGSKGSMGFEHLAHAVHNMVVPFFRMTTSDVIELYGLMGYNDVLQHTMSCNMPIGGNQHCGVCKNCIERKHAFIDANVPDPTIYLE